jgi:hypothetical protein
MDTTNYLIKFSNLKKAQDPFILIYKLDRIFFKTSVLKAIMTENFKTSFLTSRIIFNILLEVNFTVVSI